MIYIGFAVVTLHHMFTHVGGILLLCHRGSYSEIDVLCVLLDACIRPVNQYHIALCQMEYNIFIRLILCTRRRGPKNA